jgi:sodium/bile acid cotransporter 7
MALPLEARTMWQTLTRPVAPALGVLMNSVGVPLITWLVVVTVGWPLLGKDLALGLLVAAAVPCTLASAAVWTRRAGGNDAASIMVTVVTNATCFLVTPFWLLVSTGAKTELDAGAMVTKLALVVVLPMTVAQIARLARPVGHWATRHKTPLGVIAQLGVLAMIFIGSVQTGQKFASGDARPTILQMATLLVAVVGVHVFVLWAGMRIARLLRLSSGDQISVGLAGSQKTQMVGLQICIDLGFNIIPMVAYHVSQLLIDTLIADRFRKRKK